MCPNLAQKMHKSQSLFHVGAGANCPSVKPRPCPQCDTKHRRTQTISLQVQMAFRICQNAFPVGAPSLTQLEELTTLGDTCVYTPLHSILPYFGARLSAPWFGGDSPHPPFLTRTSPSVILCVTECISMYGSMCSLHDLLQSLSGWWLSWTWCQPAAAVTNGRRDKWLSVCHTVNSRLSFTSFAPRDVQTTRLHIIALYK